MSDARPIPPREADDVDTADLAAEVGLLAALFFLLLWLLP